MERVSILCHLSLSIYISVHRERERERESVFFTHFALCESECVCEREFPGVVVVWLFIGTQKGL